MKIKTGDNVRVSTGKYTGKEGKVLQVFPQINRVVVEGVNMTKKHLKSRGGKGQIVDFPSPIHASNVSVVSGSGKTGRVGYKFIEKGGAKEKVRVVRSKGRSEDLG